MKIAINRCFGSFSLSKEAYEFLGIEWDGYGYAYHDHDKRDDAKLIECIETIGEEKASGECAQIIVVEIPDDVEYFIDNYDGIETIHEVHQVWP